MTDLSGLVRASMQTAESTLRDFIANEANLREIEAVAKLLAHCLAKGNKAIIFGNGGSMCDAIHFAEELTGRFHKDRPALPAIAISDPAHITCVANDYGFDHIFSRGVLAYAKSGDVVIGISTSGNSPNVIEGLKSAQAMGCFTVGLLGRDGGALRDQCDHQLIVPAEGTDRVQEVHTLILHTLIAGVEAILYPELYPDQIQGL